MEDKKPHACICKLSGSDKPCERALERIYAMQTAAKNSQDEISMGCPWYINSAEHNYTWWNYVKTLDEPISDKEICQLLNIKLTQLKEIYNSAISKLQSNQNSPEVQEFASFVAESISSKNNDMYEYHAVGDLDTILSQDSVELDEENPKESKRGRKPKKGFGMPLHRDQNKVDLYGLYSKKTLERKKNEKK